ncbi:Voltage-gated potassium channel Kch [Botrimarina hoheduenensis]|uniref:Voltage-gated potassium channel Kch n=2 Tax=Botrimarina hoheduenensis TaxID=2528000 RepID=A0A5C5VRQ5_9BACT|nr:Voltage-gated potassium channel Kch [Botrimarina hoheduenensis]
MAMVRCVLMASAVMLIGTLGFSLIEEEWSYWDSFFFTLVTVTTVGYGDYGLCENGRAFAALILLGGIGTFTYSLSTLMQIASDVDAAARRKMKRQIAECSDHVIVCGYGRMGRMICHELDRDGRACVIVEQHPESVQQAFNDGRLVIAGRASDDEVLISAGIDRASCVVCVVDSDAENMFITVTAAELKPGVRIIARADCPSSARKLEHAGAALVVSPHQMAGKTIATALVHPRLTKFLNRGEEHAGYFELGEIVIQAGSPAEGQTVRELGSKLQGLVFVAVDESHGELVVQPSGDFCFKANDVVIFAGGEAVVTQMQRAAKVATSRTAAGV